MPHVITGVAANGSLTPAFNGAGADVPDDGDDGVAASVDDFFQAIADQLAFFQSMLIVPQNWQSGWNGKPAAGSTFSETVGVMGPLVTATGGGPWQWTFELRLMKGQIVTHVDVRVKVAAGAAATTVRLAKQTGLVQVAGDPTYSTAAAPSVTSAAASADYLLTLTPAAPITVDGDMALFVAWEPHNVNDALYGARVR